MTEFPRDIDSIATPAAMVELDRLERNTRRMSRRASEAGIALRPHLKTAKCVEVAELATAGHDGRITVSTLAEAEYFARHGFSDITYAVCAVPARLKRAAAIQSDHRAVIRLIVDDARAARDLAEEARRLAATFPVLVEIDSGEHRTGLPWDAEELIDVAEIIHHSGVLRLEGVLTHAGHSYAARDVAEIRGIAEAERRSVVDAARRLSEAGLPCPIVSAGSTPTAVHAERFDGLTEIRPGVYTFFDLAQMGRGCCEVDDIGLSVLATVIGHQRRHDRLIIDAGALALSKDTSAGDFLSDAGYGWLVDPFDQKRIGDLRVAVADQEHGYVEGSNIPFDRLPIGSKVRVLPNHACITAAAHAGYWITRDGQVVDYWARTGGW